MRYGSLMEKMNLLCTAGYPKVALVGLDSGGAAVSASGDMVSDLSAEVARWVICFVVVVVAYGIGAMALIDNSTEASDFGVDTPVVVVELPES